MSSIRIGNGIDVHRFSGEEVSDGFIILGGVEIPHSRALLAHSDGDVLTHALMDAMLGALALGDIGQHFPDSDDSWRGADSLLLLERVTAMVADAGWSLGNADITVVAQAPRLAPYTAAIQQRLAPVLGVEPSCLGVKATTSEKLGFTGREEGIAVFASVLLMSVSAPD